jgi:hypothetical protein
MPFAAHVVGMHVAEPHTFGPPPPHIMPPLQVPQVNMPPQPSGMSPQFLPAAVHVVFTQLPPSLGGASMPPSVVIPPRPPIPVVPLAPPGAPPEAEPGNLQNPWSHVWPGGHSPLGPHVSRSGYLMLLQPMATTATTPKRTTATSKLDARIRRSFSAKRAGPTRGPVLESSADSIVLEQGINVPAL